VRGERDRVVDLRTLGAAIREQPRRGPFDALRPLIVVGAVYALATVAWLVGGSSMPGGRWLAVHLFTLGVITNLILGLTDHFARALTHQPGTVPTWQPIDANAGVLTVLWGVSTGRPWAVAVGATTISVVVLASYRRLRGFRRRGLGGRFAWVVRSYERAHGAFLHGAVLGALIGTGVLGGTWFFAARTAHLHVNLLGWAGLTILATFVFLGPTIGHVRIRDGADASAARWLPRGATALTVAVLALIVTGAPGAGGTIARIVAGSALAVFATAVTAVCGPVFRAMAASRYRARWFVLGAVTWFPVVAWMDAVVVATGSWRWLEALGPAMLLGVLAQSILASLGYLLPRIRSRVAVADLDRGEVWATARAAVWNSGTLLVVLGAAGSVLDLRSIAWAGRIGWGLLLAAIAAQIAVTHLGVGGIAGSTIRRTNAPMAQS
jgi:nitrite reductase (NO-forming)